jgi:hypothetical protein
MVVKATIHKLRIAEVPTTLSPDGRTRPPHLRSWRDGWRHLRFLCLFSPRYLFLYPGAVVFMLGLLMSAWLLPQGRTVGGIGLDIHTLFYAALAMPLGFQMALFWVFAKTYGAREGIVPPDPWFQSIKGIVTLEVGLILGLILMGIGVALGVFALSAWGQTRFGALTPADTMRLVIPSGIIFLLGMQVMTGAFFLNILEIRGTRSGDGRTEQASRPD